MFKLGILNSISKWNWLNPKEGFLSWILFLCFFLFLILSPKIPVHSCFSFLYLMFLCLEGPCIALSLLLEFHGFTTK